MESKSITERLALFLKGMAYEDLPTAVIEKAKLCILDLFGAHFAGFDIESCQTVKDYISTFHGSPQATVWSLGARTLATEAAFVNGAVAHSTVFDDMHANSVSHFGSVIIPAALAFAEDKTSSGRDLILAIVCGYEVAIRVGTAMLTPEFFRSGFRPSGIFGVFGSTVATGKLLGLNHEQIINGLGLAGNFGAGLTAFAAAGTNDLIYQNGLAARNGILSAILASKGALSPHNIFEIPGGFSQAYGGSAKVLEQVVSELGDGYKIEEVYFKSIPACAFVQSTAQAALEISRREDFKLDGIKKIEVRIFPYGKRPPGLDYGGPFQGVMQAQMSNQFTVASILVHKMVDFKNYVHFRDPLVQDLARKIKIIEDAEAKSKYPKEQLVKVEVFLRDGSSRKAVSHNPHFLSDREVVDKSRHYLSRVFDHEACNQFIENVQSLETLDDVNWLTELFNRNLKLS